MFGGIAKSISMNARDAYDNATLLSFAATAEKTRLENAENQITLRISPSDFVFLTTFPIF